MATFEAQVEGLTSLTISSSGTSPTEAELTQFLTDGTFKNLESIIIDSGTNAVQVEVFVASA